MKRKRIYVDYGETQIGLKVPEDTVVARCEDPPPLRNPEDTFRQALENPIGTESFRDLVSKKSKVTIAFDAPPRSGIPKKLFIPILLEELRAGGVPTENVNLICATGSQRKRTQKELYCNLDPELFAEFWPHRLLNNDCTQDLVFLGQSELGDYVEGNKSLADSDLLIYMGTIFPIAWGGFSGMGAVIGLSSAQSIRSTHTWVIANPDSCHGNPYSSLFMKHKLAIHAQIEKATGKKIFYADSVINTKGEICGFFAGHCPEINEPEWSLAGSFFRVQVPQADILVIGLPVEQLYGLTHNPLLALTYLAMVMRTWVNKPLLKPGGVLIGMVKCSGTIDTRSRPSDQEVLNLFGNVHSASDLVDFEEEFLTRQDYIYRYRYCHAFHPAHPFWLLYEDQYLLDQAGKVIFAGEVHPEAVRKLGCIPARNFEHAWEMAKNIVGNNPTVVVVPDYMSRLKMQFYVQ
jgi:nickel-dependent lactate racemase